MATSQLCEIVSLPRGATFVGDMFEVVALNSSGQVVLTSAVTDTPVGVIYGAASEKTPPAGVGQLTYPVGSAVSVALFSKGGIMKMKAGASITRGHLVVLDATGGRVAGAANIAAVSNDNWILGIALDAADDGDIFRVIVQLAIA